MGVPFSIFYKHVIQPAKRRGVSSTAWWCTTQTTLFETVNADRITVAAVVLRTRGLVNPPHNAPIAIECCAMVKCCSVCFVQPWKGR